MIKSIKAIVIICVFGAILPACTSDKRPPLEIECDGEVPVWDIEVEPIILFSCAYIGCHVGGGNVPGNYTSFNGISRAITRGDFEIRTLELKDMPPNYATGPKELTEEEINILSCWRDAGYPEN